MYQLVIENDEGSTTVVAFPATRDELTIGRKEGNAVRLVERNISRNHARIVRSNGSFYIEDKNSYNGVKVNGDKITGRRYIKDGDSILIGDYQIKVERTDAAAAKVESAESSVPLGTAVIRVPGERDKQAAKEDSDAARLCLLSGPLAGQLYTIKKPKTRIGRKEDNDICLNHRSVSSHHAEIIESKGGYQIVDIGSANGVRVNGEEYGKIDLRKGDRIDLGHVRLLFVAPGESFVFTPALREEVGGSDASVDSGEPKKTGSMLIAAVALLVLGGGLAAYALGLFGSGTEQNNTLSATSSPTSTVIPPSVTADDAAKLTEQAKALAAEKKWQEALELAEKAGNTELASQYRPEAEANSNFAQCKTAFEAKQIDSAMAYCYLLASGTEAAKQNEQTISEVRAAFKKEHLELAKKALAKKDKAGLSTARQELKKLTDYGFASESEVASLRKNIDELAKSLPAEATETPIVPTQTPIETPSDNKAAKAEQVKSLVEEIKTLTATKKYDDALKKVDELKRLDGSNAEIYRLQAQIYMNKDNPDKACRAIKQYIKLVRGGGQASMFQEYMANQDTDSYPACAD